MTTIALGSAPVIRRYLRHLRTRRLSDETIRHADSILQGLAVRAADGGDILTLTDDQLVAWQDQRSDELAPRSLASYTSTVRCFYAWTILEGLIQVDPTRRLVTPKLPRLLPRPIAEELLKIALEAADDEMRVIMCLAAFSGLRACEIAGLDWPNVYLTGDEPYVRVIGKGNKERLVDLSEITVDALSALPHRRGVVIRRTDGRPGRVPPNTLQKRANTFLHRRCGIPDTLHQLRHRCGTEVTRVGGIHQAAQVLGHEHLSTTAGYAQVTRRDLRPTMLEAGRLRLVRKPRPRLSQSGEDEASSGPLEHDDRVAGQENGPTPQAG